MNMRRSRTYVACLMLLAACGGGGGGSESAANPPVAPTLAALGFGYKQLQFSWSAASGATSYRLSENPDGVSGYTVVASNIAGTNYNHAVASIFGRLNALYILDACNAGGCTASAPFSLATNLSGALGAYMKASNAGADDLFGTSVALSADGKTLVVGGNGDDGGPTGILVGAPDSTMTGNSTFSSGAVFVFALSSGTWSQQAYVKPSNTEAGDDFGSAVALSANGNTMAVGARLEDSAATGINNNQADNSSGDSGAVYVFTRSGTTWSQQAYVKASNTGANAQFGTSVALSTDGNTLVVGAPLEDGTATDSGAAYVFTRSGNTWSQAAYLKASNAGASDQFGTSVAFADGTLAGAVIAAGAPLEDSGHTGVTAGTPNNTFTGDGAADSGAVYLFQMQLGGWVQTHYVKASNAESGDSFGQSVALSSDGLTLAVGAPNEDSAVAGVSASNPTLPDNNGASNAGAVYVFFEGSAWAQQAYVKASNPEGSDGFGASVSLSSDGSMLAVGAPLEGSALTGIRAGAIGETTAGNGAPQTGAAYVFSRVASTWTQQAYVKPSNPHTAFSFGAALALSGDGSSLAVGAPFEESAATGIGGNQVGTCGLNTSNCAMRAGAVYLY